jgi:hypothetical protein
MGQETTALQDFSPAYDRFDVALIYSIALACWDGMTDAMPSAMHAL